MTTEQATTRARIGRQVGNGATSHAKAHQDFSGTHSYLTDGVDLYRFVDWVHRPLSAFAELEDCRSLDIVLVSTEHLARSALRPVAAASAG
jgi:hypothetical protein